MAERIVWFENGKVVTVDGGRKEGMRYADFGRDPDGTLVLREWSAEENVRRDAEEAFYAIHKNDPSPKTREELLQDRLTALKQEIETLKRERSV